MFVSCRFLRLFVHGCATIVRAKDVTFSLKIESHPTRCEIYTAEESRRDRPGFSEISMIPIAKCQSEFSRLWMPVRIVSMPSTSWGFASTDFPRQRSKLSSQVIETFCRPWDMLQIRKMNKSTSGFRNSERPEQGAPPGHGRIWYDFLKCPSEKKKHGDGFPGSI
jgi:hypothetical protein